MDRDSRIYIAGHTGLFGSTTMRHLKRQGFRNIIYRTHEELELTNQKAVNDFFSTEKPEYVFMMCGKVGGIKANAERMAEFTIDNAQMNLNIIDAAHRNHVKKLIYLGSSCMYPKDCPQPVRTEYLLQGTIEPTNEGYALAKILGMKLCTYYRRQYRDNFISCIPANVYGPGDNFSDDSSHVVPALLKRFHMANLNKEAAVSIWGSGQPCREFLYIDDAVEACVHLMEHYEDDPPVNIGTGTRTSIRELAESVAEVTGFTGNLVFDTQKPDGMMLRMLDSEKILSMGWIPKTSLMEGLEKTYRWYLEHEEENHD